MRRSTWGSKRLRYDDCWELRYPLNGKSKTEYFHGAAKQADKRLAELRIKYEGVESGDEVTIAQYFDNEFLPRIKEELAAVTIPGYINNFDCHIRKQFGDLKLSELRPKQIQKWLLSMSRATAKHARAVLSSMYSMALVDEIVDDNPVSRRYRMPKESTGKTVDKEIFKPEELAQIAGLAQGEPWEAPFLISGFGGASRYEACGVSPDDVTESGEYAVVDLNKGVHRVGHEIIVTTRLKNEFRPRKIVIEPPYAQRILKLAQEAREAGSEWLCDDGFGGPMDPNTMSTAFKRWFQSQPLVYHPFKNLRNSYATMMLSRGIDGSLVAKMIGNEVRGTTEKHYERPGVDDFMHAIEANSMGNYGYDYPETSETSDSDD